MIFVGLFAFKACRSHIYSHIWLDIDRLSIHQTRSVS